MNQIGAAIRQLRKHDLPGIVALSFEPFPEDKENYCLPRVPSAEDLMTNMARYYGELWRYIAPVAVPRYLRPNQTLGLIIALHHFVQIGDKRQSPADFAGLRFQTYEGSPPIASELMNRLYATGFNDPVMGENVLLARLQALRQERFSSSARGPRFHSSHSCGGK